MPFIQLAAKSRDKPQRTYTIRFLRVLRLFAAESKRESELFLHIPEAHAISPYGHQKTTIFGILLISAYFALSAENFPVSVCR
jgi:hypothetical protein